MATRLYGADQVFQRDQHACRICTVSVRGVLRHGILRASRSVLGLRRDGLADRTNVIHDASTYSAGYARGERVPDARGDEEHDTGRAIGARALESGRRDDERGHRDGGARGRYRVRGRAARDAREYRARFGAAGRLCYRLVWLGYLTARNAQGGQYGGKYQVQRTHDETAALGGVSRMATGRGALARLVRNYGGIDLVRDDRRKL